MALRWDKNNFRQNTPGTAAVSPHTHGDRTLATYLNDTNFSFSNSIINSIKHFLAKTKTTIEESLIFFYNRYRARHRPRGHVGENPPTTVVTACKSSPQRLESDQLVHSMGRSAQVRSTQGLVRRCSSVPGPLRDSAWVCTQPGPGPLRDFEERHLLS